MFDFKFDWKDELSIGIEALDEQHKEMFRIIRDIEQLLITKCIGVKKEQLYDVVRQLREFVSYHFYDEEELMKHYDYSLIESHTAHHREFYNQVLQIDIPRLGELPYEELLKIKDQAQEWIFMHMFQEDRHMGEEIRRKQAQE